MSRRTPTTRRAVDTSVVVAALVVGHSHEAVALPVIRGGDVGLPAHVAVEAYSVLTRLPGTAFRPADAMRAVTMTFPEPWLTLNGADLRHTLTVLADTGLTGGRAYDGLIAMTVKVHGLILVTLDRRAAPTYEALGVPFELLT